MKIAICTTCGWSGPYMRVKHLTRSQLQIRGAIDEKGFIKDPYLKIVKKRKGGSIDLSFCPNCNCFIETYYEEQTQ